ncbi:MAG: NYN domain-containing protein [Fibrobacterota bacterium]|nr:MAG: NYN domain-containing protein [Fibrobacterota bacterium]
MSQEPTLKRCIAFVDAQSLFHAARQAFGSFYPDYDPVLLSQKVCAQMGWELQQVRVYTSVPSQEENEYWHRFWMNKLRALEHQGALTWWKCWRTRKRPVHQPDGHTVMLPVSIEKGVDMRLALDIVQRAHAHAFDVALVFSQDQDFAEVADEIRAVAREQDRWIKIASAYPYSSASRTFRGIDRTDWIQIERATYDSCLDPRDYRPRRRVTNIEGNVSEESVMDIPSESGPHLDESVVEFH